MTNNPTIDGVSRLVPVELLERLARPIRKATDESDRIDARKELRALLDAGISASVAPAVERQEICVTCSGTGVVGTDDECPVCSGDDVDALQSTIAQLRIDLGNQTELTKQADYHASQRGKEIAQLQARIAELESGRGEPYGYMFYPEGRKEDEFFIYEPPRNPELRDKHDHWIAEPLYTAPPAPVAVVLPERMQLPEGENTSIAYNTAAIWNACLDATAARNGVPK